MKTVAQLSAEYNKVAKKPWSKVELNRLRELVKAGINSAVWIYKNDPTFKNRTINAIGLQMNKVKQ